MTKSEILQIAKPILFNTEMVRAIQDGRKTVTRRVMKPQPLFYTGRKYIFADDVCPKKWEDCENIIDTYTYQPGDFLYVRETWGTYNRNWWEADYFMYRADYPEIASTYTHSDGIVCDLPKWRPSIHMPKEAARIFLRVTDVRVERLQDITADEIRREGLSSMAVHAGDMEIAQAEFKIIWNSTIQKSNLDRYGWDANPWVWVIEFERVEVEP